MNKVEEVGITRFNSRRTRINLYYVQEKRIFEQVALDKKQITIDSGSPGVIDIEPLWLPEDIYSLIAGTNLIS